MLPNNHTDYSDRPTHVNHAALLNQALSLFNQSRVTSIFAKLFSVFRPSANRLHDLATVSTSAIRSRHYGGIKPVNISSIRGTLGRTHDFDAQFNPLDDRSRDRWVGIAIARSRNIPLKPVELIQVNGVYFVKDGHHRISVARALGETCIDAEVTVWHVCCRLPWEKQPAAQRISQVAA